eukprot:4104731-Prymnesium_polylepis.2
MPTSCHGAYPSVDFYNRIFNPPCRDLLIDRLHALRHYTCQLRAGATGDGPDRDQHDLHSGPGVPKRLHAPLQAHFERADVLRPCCVPRAHQHDHHIVRAHPFDEVIRHVLPEAVMRVAGVEVQAKPRLRPGDVHKAQVRCHVPALAVYRVRQRCTRMLRWHGRTALVGVVFEFPEAVIL